MAEAMVNTRADTIRGIARRTGLSRPRLDDVLDGLRLRIDTFPDGIYQPVPELAVRTHRRSEGTRSRWQAMLAVLDERPIGSAVDVGANAGFFALELARRGSATLAVDSEPASIRATSLAVRRAGLTNVGILELPVTPATVALLPPADCVVFVSVWHHLVREQGLADASAVLERLWDRTRRVLFFETGELEMTSDFALPDMGTDPRAWIAGYLSRLPEAEVRHLGVHSASDGHSRRNLFAVVRD